VNGVSLNNYYEFRGRHVWFMPSGSGLCRGTPEKSGSNL
jgi:hypothetical protein